MTGIIEHRAAKPENSDLNPSTIPPPTTINEVNNIDYRFENDRLQSFTNWPVPYADPREFAAAGFYYTGERDEVRCFECNVEVCHWLKDDNPMVDHQRWSPNCRFVQMVPCGNVPLGVDPSTVPLPVPRSRDVCGPYGIDYLPESDAKCHSCSTDAQLPSATELGYLGIARPKEPVYSEYASCDARLRTFELWPKYMSQKPEDLVEAGLYYTGKGDQTLCYHCGGGLKDWEPQDDIWEQHAKWFSKCTYLLSVKGQDYVNMITGQHITPPSKEETMKMNLPSYIKKVETETELKNNIDSECGPSNRGSPDSTVVSNVCSLSNKEEGEDLSLVKSQSTKPVDDARICKVCYNGELGIVFLPCGHMMACVKCAPGMTSCGICRKPVTMTVRAFIS